MPPKKSSIGRYTADTRRRREAEARETTPERTARMERIAAQAAELRAAQSADVRQSRRDADARRHRNVRASQSTGTRQSRRDTEARRIRNVRASQSADVRQASRDANAQRNRRTRAAESEDETAARLAVEAQRQADNRARDTPAEHAARMDTIRVAVADFRARRTEEEAAAVRAADVRRHEATRSLEHLEAAARQNSLRVLVCDSREIPDALAARRAEDARRHAEARAREYEEERDARLAADARRHREVRAAESPERVAARLEAGRIRQAQARAGIIPQLRLAAFHYDRQVNYAAFSRQQIGDMIHPCRYCGALKFNHEAPGLCCASGKVVLPALEPPLEPLLGLVDGGHPLSKHFLDNIQRYNGCFCMTSFGASEIVEDMRTLTFKIRGQVYHRHGTLLPPEGDSRSSRFLQVYFMGGSFVQADQRCRNNPGTRMTVVAELQALFNEHNALVRLFRAAHDQMISDDYAVVIHADKVPTGQHPRQYNAPTTDEVAIITTGEAYLPRDIVIWRRGESRPVYIKETHRSYDALQYPILFWQGEDGYQINIKQRDPQTGAEAAKTVSAMNFYAYRLMVRGTADQNHLLMCRNLTNQFMTDMCVKMESERLAYVRNHQPQLRVSEYIHLHDTLANDPTTTDVGKLVILPSTHIGSPRHMQQYAQDAMAYVREFGRPDLFITFTCNTKWPDLQKLLLPGQLPTHRHDIIARVFNQKVKSLMNFITKQRIFGEVRCFMFAIEWQKRGLPHAHILVWLVEKLQPHLTDDIISAELPDPDEDRELFDIVVAHMVHGPCGEMGCMGPNGRCSKKYPRPFTPETVTGHDGYPLYRRRSPDDEEGRTVVKRGRTVDNRWIVPYCPLLSKAFNAHINVEICNSIKSIKYICKYINKGSDMAVFEVERERREEQERREEREGRAEQEEGEGREGRAEQVETRVIDEISRYQMGRYICSNEAAWRIFSFPIHERKPPVFRLVVHLENGERVYFTDRTARARAEAPPPRTTLTAFFALCQEDPFAKTLLYKEVPKYYIFTEENRFQRRRQGRPVPGYPDIREGDSVGRVYTVSPIHLECFRLRMLLFHVRGPTSFSALRTVDGVECGTFHEACQKLLLLEDDGHWKSTLADAADTAQPAQIRTLFAIILLFCNPSTPTALWEKFKDAMSEDILRRRRTVTGNANLQFSPDMHNQALALIERQCGSIAGREMKDLGMPTPDPITEPCMEIEMVQFDPDQLQDYVRQHLPSLNQEQREAYTCITEDVRAERGGFYFLDAPGGTGKTFVMSLMLAKVRSSGGTAVAVASSGIAATLLDGGRTAHATFKLPLNLDNTEMPTCNVTRGTPTTDLLKNCQLIIWDECTMAHKKALEALERTLKDLRHSQELFGGALLMLSGDFRQTLPVIPRSTPADEVDACLKESQLWDEVTTLTLRTNMRVERQRDATAARFAQQLLEIGNGTMPVDAATQRITFPDDFCTVTATKDELIERVFPDIAQAYTDHAWLRGRAILAPKNHGVDELNATILAQIPGNERKYRSFDTTLNNEDAVNYPIEFLNSITPPGFPPHELKLKVGAPIILLRNISAPRLCNGTRLIVKQLLNNVIEATILTGKCRGEDVFIPRIPMIPNDLPFDFRRVQFPVRLAFAMTVNKSQGQSLEVCGLDLETPCFSHGQLYVACSRVGKPSDLFVFAPGGQTRNIVYTRALRRGR